MSPHEPQEQPVETTGGGLAVPALSGCHGIRLALCGLLLMVYAPLVNAHVGAPVGPLALWRAWSWEPGVLVPLVLWAWLYGRGVCRLWGRAGLGRGIRTWQVFAFVGGWVTLGVALVSPLDRLAAVLFSAHMVQHTLLMMLAAPLLALSRPLVPCLWGLPLAWRRWFSRRWGQWSGARRAWRLLTAPGVAWALQAVALWGWHVPSLYQATLTSQTVHALQHLSLLGSALLFWWALIYGTYGRMGYGMAVIAVFTTAVHSSMLGLLLTLAAMPWYPAYTATTATWGLLPLQDQQLAGLIMWIPAGFVYALAGLAFLASWLQEVERRTRRREARLLLDERF